MSVEYLNGGEGSLSATCRQAVQTPLEASRQPDGDLDFAPEVYDRVAPEWPVPTRSRYLSVCRNALITCVTGVTRLALSWPTVLYIVHTT